MTSDDLRMLQEDLLAVVQRLNGIEVRWRQHLTESHERTREANRAAVRRSGLYASAVAAIAVVIVGIVQIVVAREQIHETTRAELSAAISAQLAHDELLVRRTLDEHERRSDPVKPKGM